MELESPPSAAARARAADAAAAAMEEAPGDDGAAVTTRSPFKRLASRTLSDRWVQELQASPNDLVRRVACAGERTEADSLARCVAHARPCRAAQAARETKSVHFDAGGADSDEQAAPAPQDEDMASLRSAVPQLRLSPGDAAPASPAHAERSGAFCRATRRERLSSAALFLSRCEFD